jgi:hypothetical protein
MNVASARLGAPRKKAGSLKASDMHHSTKADYFEWGSRASESQRRVGSQSANTQRKINRE